MPSCPRAWPLAASLWAALAAGQTMAPAMWSRRRSRPPPPPPSSKGLSTPPRCPGPRAGADDDPYLLSWRGIDCQAYYQQDPAAYTRLLNYRWGGPRLRGAPRPGWLAAGARWRRGRVQQKRHRTVEQLMRAP